MFDVECSAVFGRLQTHFFPSFLCEGSKPGKDFLIPIGSNWTNSNNLKNNKRRQMNIKTEPQIFENGMTVHPLNGECVRGDRGFEFAL